MARAIEYLSGARLDFDESFDWYAKRSVAAAIGFAAAIDEAIDRIIAEPDRFPSTRGRCRYCMAKRYPFRIVFRNLDERLVVVAIAHAKRRPGYWRDRV